jgi:hypothetical protein
MLTRDVVAGVHRIEDSFTNWYIVEAEDGLTIIDAGVPLVARAATVDSRRNLESLDALPATGATTVLTGHGEPWTGGVAAARAAPVA